MILAGIAALAELTAMTIFFLFLAWVGMQSLDERNRKTDEEKEKWNKK